MSAVVRRGRGHRASRAYTFIEVMVALSLLAVASAGIFSLQKVATFGNLRARDLAMGTHLAQTWMERLRTDATRWIYPSPKYAKPSNIADTNWLRNVGLPTDNWFRPADFTGSGTAAFDALGNDVPSTRPADAVYCTHLRLNYTYPPAAAGAASAGTMNLIRAEVRVFWRREGAPYGNYGATVCDTNVDPKMTFDSPSTHPSQRYHFVYLASSIMENTAL